MLLPVLFLALASFALIALQFKAVKQIRYLRIALLFAVLAFFCASFGAGLHFSINEFSELDKAKVILATVFLFLAIASFFGFVLAKEGRIVPVICLFLFLAFGVAFLVFGFAYGRSNLNNETVISSSSSALAIVGLL